MKKFIWQLGTVIFSLLCFLLFQWTFKKFIANQYVYNGLATVVTAFFKGMFEVIFADIIGFTPPNLQEGDKVDKTNKKD